MFFSEEKKQIKMPLIDYPLFNRLRHFPIVTRITALVIYEWMEYSFKMTF
jgi:hypothetical protein